MIINEKRLARALKSSGAVGFRLRTVGGRMDLLGPGWAASLQLDAMDEPPEDRPCRACGNARLCARLRRLHERFEREERMECAGNAGRGFRD